MELHGRISALRFRARMPIGSGGSRIWRGVDGGSHLGCARMRLGWE